MNIAQLLFFNTRHIVCTYLIQLVLCTDVTSKLVILLKGVAVTNITLDILKTVIVSQAITAVLLQVILRPSFGLVVSRRSFWSLVFGWWQSVKRSRNRPDAITLHGKHIPVLLVVSLFVFFLFIRNNFLVYRRKST